MEEPRDEWDPAVHGAVRSRCVDLRGFEAKVTERTIGGWLRNLSLIPLQPRPFHPKKDIAAQETFKG
jgi:hypothetical protein